MSARRGMTLIEVLVAILIFSVVSLAMMGILLAGTDLFRQGEYGRSTTDAAVVALAALEDDLDRMVPEADGGLIRARVIDGSGDCVVAFKIERKDPLRVDANGRGRRWMVAWRARRDASGKDLLERTELQAYDSMDPSVLAAQFGAKPTDLDPIPWESDVTKWTPVTEGCLHFGVWLDGATNEPRERGGPGVAWAKDTAANDLPPLKGQAGDFIAPGPDPFPGTMRIVLALTGGGRFAPVGTLISDDGDSLRIAGVKALSTLPGAMLRVADEWIAYTGYAGGVVSCPAGATGRAALRSSTSAHNRGDPVRLAQFYTLVRPLGR